MLYAASYQEDQLLGQFSFSSTVGQQTIWIGASLILFLLVYIVDSSFWQVFAYPIYGICIVLLILVLLFGVTLKGATSWFSIFGFSIQPAELAKFGTALALSGFLNYYNTDLRKGSYQLLSALFIALPATLILIQPDAGTALIFLAFFIPLFREGMPPLLYIAAFSAIALFISAVLFPQMIVLLVLSHLFLAGLVFSLQLYRGVIAGYGLAVLLLVISLVTGEYTYGIISQTVIFLGFSVYAYQLRSWRLSIFLAISAILCSGFLSLAKYGYEDVLKPHQQDRINVWLKPDQCDPKGSLYNLLQSKVAIGSGGFEGKGFLNGTMTKLNYVPEQTTDFIFSIIGEEQGFLGSLGIIVLFTMLVIRIIRIGERSKYRFLRHFAYSVAGLIFLHVFINIGMTMGLVPIIGIPLPFISKGGSALIGFTIMLGVLLKMDHTHN